MLWFWKIPELMLKFNLWILNFSYAKLSLLWKKSWIEFVISVTLFYSSLVYKEFNPTWIISKFYHWLWATLKEKVYINLLEVGKKARSNTELYWLLTSEDHLYLSPNKNWSIDFITDIIESSQMICWAYSF